MHKMKKIYTSPFVMVTKIDMECQLCAGTVEDTPLVPALNDKEKIEKTEEILAKPETPLVWGDLWADSDE